MKGSLTATSSTSSLCRATLATKRPILPNPSSSQESVQHYACDYLLTSYKISINRIFFGF